MHPRPYSIERTDPDEDKLGDVFKHPIGIIFLYVQAIIGMVVAIGLSYFLLNSVMQDADTAFFIGSMFALVSIVLTILVVIVATYIYRQNRITITDRNITQVLQYGLFSRKVSQLNINNVEDVTAVQKGVLATIFNYGTLKVETAGEQMNFHFTYCPNVGYYAKIILDAREKMLGQMDKDEPIGHEQVRRRERRATLTDTSAIKDLGAKTIERANTPE